MARRQAPRLKESRQEDVQGRLVARRARPFQQIMDGRQSRRPAFARRLRVHARQLLLKGSNVPRSLQSLERLAFRKRASQQPFHHQQRITHELTQLGEVGDAAQPALVEPRGAGIAVGVVDEARAERALLDFDHRRMRYVPQAARLEHVLLRVALVDAPLGAEQRHAEPQRVVFVALPASEPIGEQQRLLVELVAQIAFFVDRPVVNVRRLAYRPVALHRFARLSLALS